MTARASLWTVVEGALVFAAFLAAYVALRQDCFYKQDGWLFLPALAGEAHGVNLAHFPHFLYLPLGKLFVGATSALEPSPFVRSGWFSASGAAAGVALLFVAARCLELPRRDALLVAGVAACAWPLVLMGTVIEVHAPFFGFAAASFLAAVCLVRSPTVLVACLLAVAMGLARAVHASGILLPVLLLPWSGVLASRRKAPVRRVLALGFFASALIPVVSFTVGSSLGILPDTGLLDIWDKIEGFAATPTAFATAAWQEWILPYLPLSVLLLAGFSRRRLRAESTVVHVATVPYLLLALSIVAGNHESGAYLLPLLLPAGLICRELLGRRWTVALVVAMALLSLWRLHAHEASRAVDREYAVGAFEAAAGEPARVLCWSDSEIDSLLLHRPDRSLEPWSVQLLTVLSPAEQAQQMPMYPLLLADKKRLLTETAERELANPVRGAAGPTLLEFLRKTYRFTRVERRGFRGSLLELK